MNFHLGDIPPAILASLIAAAFAVAGTLTVVTQDAWARANRVYFTAFAAGILMTTGLMLFPDIIETTPNAPVFAIAGYLALYTINIIFSRSVGAVLAPLLAIGVHSFLDGFQYGILFDHDPHTGWTASAGLIAHEFAEGVILYTFLRAAKVPVAMSVFASIVGAAVTTPLGAVTATYGVAVLSEATVGMLLAASAGALIYLGATHLPAHDAQRARKPLAIIFYVIGIVMALLLSLSHNHGPDEHDHDHDDDHDHAIVIRAGGPLVS